jgi:hypothetical protein
MEANKSQKEISARNWQLAQEYNQALYLAKKAALSEYGDARRWQEFFCYQERAVSRGSLSLDKRKSERQGATEMKTKSHPADEAAIKGIAKQFAVPVKLAREAYQASDRSYLKAYEYLLALAKSGKL